ncbi:hypothetical protein J2X06_002949 [Lysobacter niastensis]|uniref:Uncharacterized protein n=1 Tax=Lysobacter niastensis TaxID=380629 RepID=A0ABU1WDN5_9GAMM|nr:hypothetical protein [Lysobacter niastensis]MDR7135731.1 hypothetical protein [Lysobacter niastensis]
MTKFLAICVFVVSLAVCACSSAPAQSIAPVIPVELIPLEQAKTLITSGQVKEIFQPHYGCVVLTLRNGEYLSFEQPHLDWVLTFVEEAGLEKQIPISVE